MKKLIEMSKSELLKALEKKLNKIDYINDKFNLYKANGNLSKYINLNEITNAKTLETCDYFLDIIRDEKQEEDADIDYYDFTNNEIIETLGKNDLIDFNNYLYNYSYELICNIRDYRNYKKELNNHEIGDIWY